jgi:hypothetical protein
MDLPPPTGNQMVLGRGMLVGASFREIRKTCKRGLRSTKLPGTRRWEGRRLKQSAEQTAEDENRYQARLT